MSLAESLRTGLRFLLMSLGVSSPDKKQKPVRNGAPDPRSGAPK